MKTKSLGTWITEVGPVKVASLLKVNVTTVYHWRTGHALPKPEQLLRIHRLSLKAVSISETIKNHFYGKKSAK